MVDETKKWSIFTKKSQLISIEFDYKFWEGMFLVVIPTRLEIIIKKKTSINGFKSKI